VEQGLETFVGTSKSRSIDGFRCPNELQDAERILTANYEKVTRISAARLQRNSKLLILLASPRGSDKRPQRLLFLLRFSGSD
jgi:hypothetical protein